MTETVDAVGTDLALIALDKITPNPHNPRKTFAEDALAQLAQSVREKGVLEPILVRPLGKYFAHKNILDMWYLACPRGKSGEVNTLDPFPGDDGEARCRAAVEKKNEKAGYELVAGERRWRAAKLAGLKVIPALIRNLDDKAAAEVAVIENDQREDVPPLEQAEGYGRLIELGDDAETIAAKIGRPVKYVVGRLQLGQLVDDLKTDLRSGKLPFGHAYLLSRLKPDDQRVFTEKRGYGGSTDLFDYDGRVVSLTALRKRIRDGFLPCLSAAPWKKDDAALVPKAGACTSCPRRSGSNPTLFDELLGEDAPKKGRDFCTDRTCYQGKGEAFLTLQLKTAKEQCGAEPLKLTSDWYTRSPDVLTKGQYEIVTAKEARKAKPGELKTAVVVDAERGTTDGIGRIVQVRVKNAPEPSSGSKSGQTSFQRQEAARRKKAEAYKSAAQTAIGLVAAKVESVVGNPEGGAAAVKLLRHLAAALTDCGGADACRRVIKRRGLRKPTADKAGIFEGTRSVVNDLAHSLDSARELLGLMAEIIAAHAAERWCFSHYSGQMNAEEKAFWAAFGVDRSKLLKEVEAETRGPGIEAKRKRIREKKAARKAKVRA